MEQRRIEGDSLKLEESDIDLCWKKLAERMEEEVLDKYKVEESKKDAFRGGGASLWNGGRYAKTRDTEYESGKKIAGQEISRCLENTTCSVGKASRRSQRKMKR